MQNPKEKKMGEGMFGERSVHRRNFASPMMKDPRHTYHVP